MVLPSISCLFVTDNETQVQEAIDSFLIQTYKNTQLIIILNSSIVLDRMIWECENISVQLNKEIPERSILPKLNDTVEIYIFTKDPHTKNDALKGAQGEYITDWITNANKNYLKNAVDKLSHSWNDGLSYQKPVLVKNTVGVPNVNPVVNNVVNDVVNDVVNPVLNPVINPVINVVVNHSDFNQTTRNYLTLVIIAMLVVVASCLIILEEK
jgi:hypothetical protein